MRPRALIVDMDERPTQKDDTYARVRRTLDDALAELELPLDRLADVEHAAPHSL
jgi:hypothetical protein